MKWWLVRPAVLATDFQFCMRGAFDAEGVDQDSRRRERRGP